MASSPFSNWNFRGKGHKARGLISIFRELVSENTTRAHRQQSVKSPTQNKANMQLTWHIEEKSSPYWFKIASLVFLTITVQVVATTVCE